MGEIIASTTRFIQTLHLLDQLRQPVPHVAVFCSGSNMETVQSRQTRDYQHANAISRIAKQLMKGIASAPGAT